MMAYYRNRIRQIVVFVSSLLLSCFYTFFIVYTAFGGNRPPGTYRIDFWLVSIPLVLMVVTLVLAIIASRNNPRWFHVYSLFVLLSLFAGKILIDLGDLLFFPLLAVILIPYLYEAWLRFFQPH